MLCTMARKFPYILGFAEHVGVNSSRCLKRDCRAGRPEVNSRRRAYRNPIFVFHLTSLCHSWILDQYEDFSRDKTNIACPFSMSTSIKSVTRHGSTLPHNMSIASLMLQGFVLHWRVY